MFAVKLLFESDYLKNKKSDLLKKYGVYFGGSIFVTLILMIYAEVLPGINTITGLFGGMIPQASKKIATSGGGWFSLSYMKEYFPSYIRTLFGGYQMHFLWDNTPIWPLFIGIPGVFGLIIGVVRAKTRLFAIALLIAILSSIVFMSSFYSQDMRYLNFAIPTILIGFVMFWHEVLSLKMKSFGLNNITRIGFPVILCTIFLFYFGTNAIRLKKQIMLNLKYAETPWYYLSVVKLNEYFKDYPKTKKIPVVISAMIPYYIDFYSNGEYSLLPLSLSQEFRDHREAAWGKFDYSDLIMLYSKTLYSGHEIYVHNYGIGNEKILQEDFKKIQDAFILTKVAIGCFDACSSLTRSAVAIARIL
ncbi:MAG: hypothetical protein WCG27_11175 [Pseudomonadota bacterium]